MKTDNFFWLNLTYVELSLTSCKLDLTLKQFSRHIGPNNVQSDRPWVKLHFSIFFTLYGKDSKYIDEHPAFNQ